MGFDVTYHPVTEHALHAWYFDFLLSDASVANRCRTHDVPDLFRAKIEAWVAADRALPAGSSFDATVGFHAAAACGIFSRYHYLRGCRLSKIQSIGRYTKAWHEIVPTITAHSPARNRAVQNYSSGVFIPPESVRGLRHDIDADPRLRDEIRVEFPDSHFDVLRTALDEAIVSRAGLLEATDVIEPDPFDLNRTTGASNRLNCELAGPLLYRDTARLQTAGIPDFARALEEGRVERTTVMITPDGATRTDHDTGSTKCHPTSRNKGWALVAVMAVAALATGWMMRTVLSASDPDDPAFIEPLTWIDSLGPDDPWPRWDESLLRPECFDGGTAAEQFLMCRGPDGTLEWTRADLGEDCRMYPVPGDVTVACRPPS